MEVVGESSQGPEDHNGHIQSSEEDSSQSSSSEEDSYSDESDDSVSSDSELSENQPVESTFDENTWFFESYDHYKNNSNIDQYIFWVTQVAAGVFWCIFSFLKIISLSLFWGMLVTISAYLSLVNLYAYYKCQKDHESKLAGLFMTYGGSVVNMDAVMDGVQTVKKLHRKHK